MDRIEIVRARLAEEDAEASAVLLTHLPNIRWACGFTGSNARLLVTPERAHFLTDGRYDAQAHAEVQEATVHVVRGSLDAYMEDEQLFGGLGRVAVQSDHLTVGALDALSERFPEVAWIPVRGLLNVPVAQKTDAEVNRIRASQRVTEAVFGEILELLRPGQTEKDIAAEIVYRHLQRGVEGMSFPPIVASGPNAARPHARPTDRVLQPGDLLLIDMGGILDGYASDMTRTVALGDPGSAARDVYALVLEAQTAALDAARAGMTSDALDAVARDVIADAGLKDAFAHGLGHGLGLEVHEWPRVSYTAEYELPEGACVTIEPGVYRAADGVGVRIEDIVVLRDGGSTNLTSTPKDLLVL
jgi:Xaa-Pro aminopeptidase